jgi:hypothetical protein
MFKSEERKILILDSVQCCGHRQQFLYAVHKFMSGGVDPSRIPKELHKSLKGPGRLRIRFKESKKSRISPSKRLRQGANKAIFLIKIVTFLQWA